jgi:hypothetical protein
MATTTVPITIRGKQRAALVMLVIAGTLNYLDRSTTSYCQCANSPGTWALDRRYRSAAVRILVGLCHSHSCQAERWLTAWDRTVCWERDLALWSIAQAAAGFVRVLLAVLDRTRVPGPGRGADVFLGGPRGARLVQCARPRAADGDLELHVIARARHCAADPDGTDDQPWLALDVRDHGASSASSSPLCGY